MTIFRLKKIDSFSDCYTPLSMSAQALHTEIKGKKEKVEDVQKDADTCASSIKVGSKITLSL